MSEDLQATFYANGNIFTMDRELPRAESLLVRGGRIEMLGPTDLLRPHAGDSARQVDLQGASVVPGFNDCHCHILSFGLKLEQVDVSVDAVRSIADIKRVVAERAWQTPAGAWIEGRGYDQNMLEERRHPTRLDLDPLTPNHPVVLWHTSGHALTCNSRALQLAGITAHTKTPSGGDIERDQHGQPTGVLKEAPASDLLANAIPLPSIERGANAIVHAMKVMASQGITSASDAATGHRAADSTSLDMYRRALDSGELAGRITLMPQIVHVAPPTSDEIHQVSEFRVGNQPDWLAVGPVKIFSDGALTTRTAALREPYQDETGDTGLLIWEPDTLADMIQRAHQAGWQIATHAIGDRAVEVVVSCYEQAQATVPQQDRRHRIEHCMLLDRDLASRIKQLGIVPVLQPGFVARLGDAYITGLGMERASQLMPMQLFDFLGIPVAFSSDRPVIPGLPLQGIQSAMQRVTPQGIRLGPEHTVTALEAIRHYTVGSAFATHSEQRIGMLRRGMPADFTVLSHNPALTTAEEFHNVQVLMTFTAGEEVYIR